MFSKIWLINLVLAVFAVFFGLKAYGVWSEGEKSFSEAPLIEKPSSRPKKRIVKKRAPPESAYSVVVEKNLFAPGRTGSMPEKSESGPDVKQLMVAGKRIIVSGVIMMDGYEAALVGTLKHRIDRRRSKTNAGEWDSEWVKVGDTIGDFQVAGIKEDRVIFTEGAKEYEIFLYDKDKPKRQIPATKKAKPKAVKVAPKNRTARPQVSKR